MTINSSALPLYPQSFAARVIYFANGLAKRSATVGIVSSKVKDINSLTAIRVLAGTKNSRPVRFYGRNSMDRGSGIKIGQKKVAPNAIFRVVSCSYILYDLTRSFLVKKSTHSLSYET
jgi:hypothetical protein